MERLSRYFAVSAIFFTVSIYATERLEGTRTLTELADTLELSSEDVEKFSKAYDPRDCQIELGKIASSINNLAEKFLDLANVQGYRRALRSVLSEFPVRQLEHPDHPMQRYLKLYAFFRLHRDRCVQAVIAVSSKLASKSPLKTAVKEIVAYQRELERRHHDGIVEGNAYYAGRYSKFTADFRDRFHALSPEVLATFIREAAENEFEIDREIAGSGDLESALLPKRSRYAGKGYSPQRIRQLEMYRRDVIMQRRMAADRDFVLRLRRGR